MPQIIDPRAADICPRHGKILRTTSGRVYCSTCEFELEHAVAPQDLTADEREQELRFWMESTMPGMVDPDHLLARAEALIGRSVTPLEYTVQWDELIEEARANGPE